MIDLIFPDGSKRAYEAGVTGRDIATAATSPNADAFAYAAAQVKKAIEVTYELGGEGYTFWGGREGYSTLWNTDMKRELEHLAKFLHMAVDYAKQIGFKGQCLHLIA